MSVRDPQILLGPLGVRVDLYDDEWLQSAISRWAYDDYHCSRAALLTAMGLGVLDPKEIHQLGVRIRPEVADAIALALDIPTEQLQAATLHSLDDRALRIEVDRSARGPHARILTDIGWTRRAGTRYCPLCLEEHPGVFRTEWRLTWAFACVTHAAILEDVCPGCGKPPRDTLGSPATLRDPNCCWNNISTTTKPEYCGTDLRLATPVTIGADAPVLQAQRWVHAVVAEAERPLAELGSLAGAMAALRATGDVPHIADVAQLPTSSLQGLIEPEARVGASAPKDALAFAALAAAAHHILTGREDSIRSSIRAITFGRPPGHVPRSAGYGPGSPRELLERWGKPAEPLASRVLRAHDHDLKARDRILNLSALTEEDVTRWAARPPGSTNAHNSWPTLLWNTWSIPLLGRRTTDAYTFRSDIAAVLSERSNRLRPALLGDPPDNSVVRALCLLRVRILRDGAPIDYGRRLTLDWDRFLPTDAWRQVCRAADADPGRIRRHLIARRWAFERLTGAAAPQYPHVLRQMPTRHDAADLTAFVLTMTAHLQDAVDDYAREFLQQEDRKYALRASTQRPLRDEPVTWSPPRDAIDRASAPGREVDDIDWEQLYHLTGATKPPTLTALSRELQRTPAHIRAAVELRPRPAS
ncbi:TniQ family protein [Curtobacterium sp. TXMA1]|uniref:TniQ family protein n=1 Tax=Curtobacterium sp. TXMA1 TaxID=2876939 RepID=UPI001CCB820A|nr:TniQ family protein [Curtobacterium sp. TXMA1]UBQ02526.1 TniQ family protein [Curtobacterium sp. TXMA1]